MSSVPNNLQTDVDRPPGRRARKALAVRRALFDAGLAAFERQPLGLVSILDITEAADVAKGVFYLQFGSKDEFLIALWEDRQRSFLDAVRSAVAGCATDRDRLAAAVGQYARTAADSPPTARFWLRMSGYFSDEIGQPGELTRLRREFLRRLAADIAGVSIEQLGPGHMRLATVADACCWGMISGCIQLGAPALEADLLVQTVAGAVEPFLTRSRPAPARTGRRG